MRLHKLEVVARGTVGQCSAGSRAHVKGGSTAQVDADAHRLAVRLVQLLTVAPAKGLAAQLLRVAALDPKALGGDHRALPRRSLAPALRVPSGLPPLIHAAPQNTWSGWHSGRNRPAGVQVGLAHGAQGRRGQPLVAAVVPVFDRRRAGGGVRGGGGGVGGGIDGGGRLRRRRHVTLHASQHSAMSEKTMLCNSLPVKPRLAPVVSKASLGTRGANGLGDAGGGGRPARRRRVGREEGGRPWIGQGDPARERRRRAPRPSAPSRRRHSPEVAWCP